MWKLSAIGGLLLAIACSSQHDQTVSFEVKPIPPSLTSGTGRASLNGQGDLVLEVSVKGPVDEISKSGPDAQQQGNILWHLLQGSCAAWQRNEPGHKVIARWSFPPQHPDAMDFRYVISRGDLDATSRPYAVAAYRNGGGGPLYACGDVPALPGS